MYPPPDPMQPTHRRLTDMAYRRRNAWVRGGQDGLASLQPGSQSNRKFWDGLERQVRENHPPPATLPALLGLLQQEWLAIPQVFLRWYAMSVRRRCVDCMGSGGGYTHYWLFSWTEMNMCDFCEFLKRIHCHKSVNKPWIQNQNVLKFCVHGAEYQT